MKDRNIRNSIFMEIIDMNKIIRKLINKFHKNKCKLIYKVNLLFYNNKDKKFLLNDD